VRTCEPDPRRNERGTALVVTMLLLVMMGVIGLAALETTMRDQQVAGFQNNSRLALYAAEAGLSEAKNRLRLVFDTNDNTPFLGFPNCGAPGLVAPDLDFTADYRAGSPSYCGDPTVAQWAEFQGSGQADRSSGHGFSEGSQQWFNTLWRLQVQGQAAGNSLSRVDVMATRQLTGGVHYN
jgi:Tfp pilus assembly protein PilX